MKSRMRSLVVAGVVIALLFLAGCSGIGNGISTTEGDGQTTTTGEEAETTTTKAPETTETSGETATTAAPDTGDDTSNTRLYVVIGIIVLAVLIIAIIAINASRRSKKAEARAAGGPAAPAAPASAWKATAEQAYAQSRWLYENLTPEIAQWRGDSLHKSGDQASDTTSTQGQMWNQLGTQMMAATSTLYSLEVQVDPASQQVVRPLIDSLNNTRTALDDVASARLAVNQAAEAFMADSGNQLLQQNLSAAHDRENQSVQNLNGNRTVLYGALANLAALK